MSTPFLVPLAVIVGILSPIYIWLSLRYWVNRHNAVYLRRQNLLINIFVIILLANLFIYTPFDYMQVVWFDERFPIMRLISSVLNHVIWTGSVYVAFLWFSLLRFDVKLSQSMSESKWTQFINEDHQTQMKICCSVHSPQSTRRFIHLSILVWILAGIVKVLLAYFVDASPDWHGLMRNADSPILFFAIFGTWMATPKFLDFFRIQKQLQVFAALGGLELVTLQGVYLISEWNIVARHVYVSTVSLVFSLGFLWLVVEYPFYLISESRACCSLLVSDGRTSSNQGLVNFRDLVQTYDWLTEFMDHVLREFSQENMLFLMEISQLKNYIFESLVDEEQKRQINMSRVVKLPERVPQSMVVFQAGVPFYEKCVALFEKYVREGAVFEVNLSGACRQEVTDFFVVAGRLSELESEIRISSQSIPSDSAAVNDVAAANAFDRAYDEILSLISDSLTRFDSSL